MQPWSYTPPSRFVQAIGQAPDGTLYVKETTDDEWSAQSIVGLDGATGRVTFRVNSSGSGHWVRRNGSYLTCTPGALWDPGLVGHPLSGGAVGYDGAVYVLTYGEADTTDTCADTHAYHREIQVLRVRSDGQASTTVLDAADVTTSLSGGREQVWRPTTALVPDPRGGAHAEWTVSSYGGGQPSDTVTRHAYAAPDAQGLTARSAVAGRLPFDRIGDGVGFDSSGLAYDLDTEAVRYTPPVPQATYVAALVGGGVAIRSDRTLVQFDAAGATLETSDLPFPAANLSVGYVGGGMWHGEDEAGVSLFMKAALSDYPADYPDLNGAHAPSGPQRVTVGIDFFWDVGFDPQEVGWSADELALVKNQALQRLESAFGGYQVCFREDRKDMPRHMHVLFMGGGGQGQTDFLRNNATSQVNFTTVETTLLTVVGCSDVMGAGVTAKWDACAQKLNWTRLQLARALGTGVGTTAAHELGHQGGLLFTRHLGGLDCYDGDYVLPRDGPYDDKYWVHFLGQMGWSDDAKMRIKAEISPVR